MVSEKLKELRLKISSICKRVGRSENEIKLVLVTKQVASEAIKEAYELGVRDFGENRVQEWLEKKDKLPRDIRWHFIGHLQTNKARYCAQGFQLIHSLDSIKLALALETEAAKKNSVLDCLIQINASGEKSKYGMQEEEVELFVQQAAQFSHIRLSGLMAIAPLTEDETLVRTSFQRLRACHDQLKERFPKIDWKYLSLGMSSDFEIALEEGANLLRIGTAVFGARG